MLTINDSFNILIPLFHYGKLSSDWFIKHCHILCLLFHICWHSYHATYHDFRCSLRYCKLTHSIHRFDLCEGCVNFRETNIIRMHSQLKIILWLAYFYNCCCGFHVQLRSQSVTSFLQKSVYVSNLQSCQLHTFAKLYFIYQHQY